MKKLYFAALIAMATQLACAQNNKYPLLRRLPEENLVRKNCENLNTAFLGFFKKERELSCDSLERRLAIVAKEKGFLTQGFAFSHLDDDRYDRYHNSGNLIQDEKADQEIIDTTKINQLNIQIIVGGAYHNHSIGKACKKAKKDLEDLARKLCDERTAQEKNLIN